MVAVGVPFFVHPGVLCIFSLVCLFVAFVVVVCLFACCLFFLCLLFVLFCFVFALFVYCCLFYVPPLLTVLSVYLLHFVEWANKRRKERKKKERKKKRL